MSQPAKSFVYGLTDPRTNEVRYIGKTVLGMIRPKQHGAPCRLTKDRTHKGNWIRKLRSAGLDYGIVVLEEVPREKLAQAEQAWVQKARLLGWDLTNLTEGGEGLHGYVFSPEHRAKISAANSGRKLSSEVRLRLSVIAKARPVDPVRLQKFLAASPTEFSEEHRRKIGDAHRGKVYGAETRKKISEATSRPIIETGSGRRFSSQKAASEELGVCLRSISRVLSGQFSQTKGYRFAYAP